jgi:hypothetical protein
MNISTTSITRFAATAVAGTALALAATADADARSPKHSPVKRALKSAKADHERAPAPAEWKVTSTQLPNGGEIEYVDTDGDGRVDLIVMDLDGDNDPDRAFVLGDNDGDGQTDVILVDEDGDGDFDLGALDRDRDGKFDTRWVDRNGDGKWQSGEIERIKPDKGARKPGKRGGKVYKLRFDRCRSVHRARTCLVRSPHRVFGLPAKRLRLPAPNQPLPVQQQDPQPQPQPQPRPQPPVVTPLGAFDADGDGEKETVLGDEGLANGQGHWADDDRDGDADGVTVGTHGGTGSAGAHNLDNDPKDEELVLTDPGLAPGQVLLLDIDRDGDPDVVWVGTHGGAELGGAEDLDNDPADKEIVVYDPMLPAGQSHTTDVDRDGDADVKVIGTR